MKKDFPVNVFPDVERNAFKKFSKKNVTEDYIKENLKRKGWECYKPFTDTGIDLLATKLVDGIKIYRYIQIKTRSLDSDDKFGYTLTSKDFVTDPRKFYFLYCDTTDDVLILSTYDYLKMFFDIDTLGLTHFAVPSFRKNNNKLNSLKYSDGLWKWSYGYRGQFVDMTAYLNDSGLSKMESTNIEKNYEHLINEISDMKFKMFYRLKSTSDNNDLFKDNTGESIKDSLKKFSQINRREYIKRIKKIKTEFRSRNKDLYESHCRYVIDEMLKGDSNE